MIPISQPTITDLEKHYLDEAVNNSDIGVGGFIADFEQAWADYNHRSYGVACNSGTNAIYLALKALGLGPGDEVLVPEFTMIATAWAVTYTGATPVFVDCLDDLTIDWVEARHKLTKRTKAVIAVPIYGRSVGQGFYDLAKDANLFIVEDMAEGHGIKPRGDISCYSFYGNKILTTGEGGMCLTNDKRIAEEMRSLANMYFDKNRTLLHPKVGHNFRLTNIQAAIGLAQVNRADEIIEKRHKIAGWYDKYLPRDFLMPKRDVVWVYDIDCGHRQQLVKEHLAKKGVDSRYFFKPMSQQPMYKGDYQSLEAYQWSKRGLYLPCYYDLTEEEVKYIAECLKSL